MNYRALRNIATALFAAGTIFLSFQASPEDIDIFSVDEGSSLGAPNVLIILDNTSNWSRASQKWPGGEVQGQAEVAAIKQVITGLSSNINVGLMEYITGGSSSDTDSAYLRAHIRPMIAANKQILIDRLDTIYGNINGSEEKRSSSNSYGNLMWDTYNYLAGANHSNGGAGTPATLASSAAYNVNYSKFRTPLTSNDTCTRTIVIFIGNNGLGTLTSDSAANVAALKALAGGGVDGDTAAATIPFAEYVVTSTPTTTDIGYSACFASAAACTTAINTPAFCTENGFSSCSCATTGSIGCPSTKWIVTGFKNSIGTTTDSDWTTPAPMPVVWTGEAAQCQKNAPNGACTLPPTATRTLASQNCPTGIASCVASASQTSTITTSWTGACSYINSGVSCGVGGKVEWRPSGARTERAVVTHPTSTPTQTNLGETTACYNDAASCTPTHVGVSCAGYNSCSCTSSGSSSGCAAGNTSKFKMSGASNIVEATPTGTYSPGPANIMMDEWARFLRNTGVTVPGLGVKNQVTTYTVDVFNAQQNAQLSALWFNAARVGGGKYFQAKDKNQIVDALTKIFTEVQAVNSAFSSASLPINATNRTQNENQVFIGVFKPNRTKDPQWFGNLKRFQIIRNGAAVELGDANGNNAVNNQTGFLSDCAVSYWTTASGNYWATVSTDEPAANGICPGQTPASDSPDGPFVEKGAVAEVLRKGNINGALVGGNYVLDRSIWTLSGTSLVPFNAANFDDGNAATDEAAESIVTNFIRGQDLNDDDNDTNTTEPRSTIHGDVVHSRPQPINYGASTGVVIFYGSNDGHFRAVKASNGQELWSFIAPEHFKKLKRLRDSGIGGGATIKYFGDSSASSLPKDYFFDGPTGTFQQFTNNAITKAWVYPTMRRGGRMLYAFDVTNPASPVFKWKAGCPNPKGDNTGCTVPGGGTDIEKIGQTWSNSSVAFIKGYSETTPVIIAGGGYDDCDDDNSKTPCAATQGRGVFVFDAFDGHLVKFFDFSSISGARGVVADVALISIDPDKFVDFAYAADTGGNVYRMNFINFSTKASLASTAWTSGRVAYSNGFSRKFQFAPSLLQAGGSTVYLALGSGDREHPLLAQYPYGTEGTPSSAVLNRFYAYKDDLSVSGTETNLDGSNMKDYSNDPSCTTPGLNAIAERGWYMDLNDHGQGEQVVSSAVIAGGFINFSTNRPTRPDAAACVTSLGEARGYFVNLLNGSGAIGVNGSCGGSQSSTFVGGGLPPSPVIATVLVGDRVETIVIGAVPKDGGAASAISPTLRNPFLNTNRRPVYWYKTSGDN